MSQRRERPASRIMTERYDWSVEGLGNETGLGRGARLDLQSLIQIPRSWSLPFGGSEPENDLKP